MMISELVRETKETTVHIHLSAQARVDTTLPFYDHMIHTFVRYAGLPLVIEAKGDLEHHIVEDVALTLGSFLRKNIPKTAARFGERTVAMDEALVRAVVDFGGRPYFVGKLPHQLYTHWFRSLADSALLTLHLDILRGEDLHHLVEAAFKSTGLALADAMREGGTVFSTKGNVSWSEIQQGENDQEKVRGSSSTKGPKDPKGPKEKNTHGQLVYGSDVFESTDLGMRPNYGQTPKP